MLFLFCAFTALASFLPSPFGEGRLLDVVPARRKPPEVAPVVASSALGTSAIVLEPIASGPPPSEDSAATDGSGIEAHSEPAVDAQRAQLAVRVRAELASAGTPAAPIVRPCLEVDAEQTCTRRALDRYLEQLVLNALGTATRPARFSQLGDSLILGDGFTGELRRLMHPWFGDGGHGFLYIGEPERTVGSEGIVLNLSEGWRVRTVIGATARDPLFGIAGAAFQPEESPTFSAQASSPPIGERMGVLWYPRTNSMQLVARFDGARTQLDVAVESGRSALTWVDLPESTRRVTLDNFNRNSIYYGVLFENRVGVVFDNMGLVSGNIDRLMRIDPDHWRDQLRDRDSDVVSFFYGVNSAGAGQRDRGAAYRDEYAEVLARYTSLVPERDCLVLSMLTRGEWVDGDLRIHPGVAPLVAAQQEAAARTNCAFWSSFEAAGALDSVEAWYRNRPQLLGSDLAHPTRAGYVELARLFHHALLAALDEYLHEFPNGHTRYDDPEVSPQ